MKHPRLLLAFLLCLLGTAAQGSMLAAAYSPHVALAQRLAALPAMSRAAIAQNVGPTPLSQAAADRLYADAIKPESFGAKANDLVDDTAALQAAIDKSASTGIPVYGRGKYRLSASLTLRSGFQLIGNKCELVMTSATAPWFVPPAQTDFGRDLVHDYRFENITFSTASGTDRADSTVALDLGWSTNPEFSRCFWYHCGGTLLRIGTADTSAVSSGLILDRCGSDGAYLTLDYRNHVDALIARNYFNLDSTTAYGHYRFRDHAEAVRSCNNDLIDNKFYADLPTQNLFGTQAVVSIESPLVRHSSFVNDYYDSFPGAIDAPAGFDNDWVGCWFAGAGKRANVRLYGTARAFGFTSCKFFGSGYAALDIEAGDGYTVDTCRFTGAQVKASSGPVVHVFSAVTGATFLGNTLLQVGQEQVTGHATVGVQVDAGATNVGVGGFNHVDPLIATGYSHYTADATVKVSSENFGADSPISTTYAFREDFSGTGTVDNAHALDAGGTPSGPLVLAKTGDGYGYPTTPGELLVTAPRGLRIDFALRATGSPVEFQGVGFKHCYADSSTHYQITVSRSGTHYFFDLYKVDPALNASIGQGYTKMTPSFDLTNATGFTGGAVGLSYTCSADGTTHRILKSDGTVLLTATDTTGTPPLAAGKSGWYAGAAMDSGNSIQVGATSAMAQ